MKNRPLIAICFVFLVVRYLYFLAGDQYDFPLEVARMDGKEIRVSGRIVRREKRENGPRWYLNVKNRTYIIYGSEKSNCRIGNTIAVSGTFYLFEKASNPGAFDSRSYYHNQHIYGNIIPKKITVTDHTVQYGKEWLFSLREKWKEELVKRMGEKGAVLSGILLGDKSEMQPETKELYQKNGIAHLLAVSGLHVSFVGLLIYRGMRKAGLPFWFSAAAGISVLFPYAVMTGFSVSAKRAVIMYLIRMGAEITGRVYDLLTSLAVAGTIILVSAPRVVFDTGFLLSFGAIFAIWTGESIKIRMAGKRKADRRMPKKQRKNGIAERILNTVWPGLWIQFLTFPVLLSSYYEFPLYSVFMNIWVIPLMTVVMGAGFAGSLFCLVNFPAAGVVLQISKVVLSLYEWSCRLMLELPMARIITGKPYKIQLVIYSFMIILSVGFLWNKKKRAGSLFLIMGALSLLGPWNGHQYGKAVIAMIDVGQGDGFFLQTPGGVTCLIDGGSISEEMLARYTLEPFLESRRIGKLDYVWVTHGDRDHISGIQEMVQRQKLGVRIGTLIMPEKRLWNDGLKKLAQNAENAGINVRTIKAGEKLQDPLGAEIRCLGPSGQYHGENGNEASLVLAFSFRKFSLLFTGDLEGAGEDSFLKGKYGAGTYTVLKVAHHGSDSSTTEEFLRKNDFEYALISAGKDNLYGHPGKELMTRLKEKEIKSFCTKDVGAVMMKTDGNTLTIQKFLNESVYVKTRSMLE